MFVKTLSDREIFAKTVSLLLGEEITLPEDSVINYEDVKEVKSTRKGIRNDVYSKDRLVDVEMENIFKKDFPLDKRSGVYTGHIVIDSLDKNKPYKDKKDTYVIFLCNFQPFEENSYHYVAKYECKATNTGKYVKYDTGDYHHFFNLTYDGDDIPKELKELFTYIVDTRPENVPEDSELIKMIDKRVQYIKNSENMQEEFNMINLYENEIYVEGISQGEHKKAISVAKKLLKKRFSIEDIVECSGLSIDEVKKLSNENLQPV